MSTGRTWPLEWKVVKDPVSGVEIRQLTDLKPVPEFESLPALDVPR